MDTASAEFEACKRMVFSHEDHPYVLWIMSSINLCYVLLSVKFGIYIMQITTTGLPSLFDAYNLLITSIVTFSMTVETSNILSLRHGWPNNALSFGFDIFAVWLALVALWMHVAHTRKVFYALQGIEVMPPREIRAFVVVCCIFFALGVGGGIVHVLGSVGLATERTQRWIYKLTLLSTSSATLISAASLLFLHWLRKRDYIIAHDLLSPYRWLWTIGIFLSMGVVYLGITMDLPPASQRCYLLSVQNPNTIRDFVISSVVAFGLAVVVLKSTSELMKRLDEQGVVREYDWRNQLGYCIFFGAIFLNGIAVPQMLAFDLLEYFFDIQIFVVCIGVTSYFVSRRPREEDLDDWTVAGLVCMREDADKKGWMRTNASYSLPWVCELGGTSFLLASIACARVIPWKEGTGMHSLDVFRFIGFDGNLHRIILRIAFFVLLTAYYIDSSLSALERLFPVLRSPSLGYGKVIGVLRYLLYMPCLLIGLRVLLSGIRCTANGLDEDVQDTVNALNDVACDGLGWHRTLVHIVMICATGCIVTQALRFSHENLYSKQPGMTQAPAVRVARTCLRMVVVMSMRVASEKAMVAIGFVVVSGTMVLQYVFPALNGFPKVNAMQLSVTSCVVVVHIAGVMNFAVPERWLTFILMLVFLPLTAFGAYVFGMVYRRTRIRDDRLAKRAEHVYGYNFNAIDDSEQHEGAELSARDLAAALYSENFNRYLRSSLSTPRISSTCLLQASPLCKGREEAIEYNAPQVALMRLAHALSVDCGQRALSLRPHYYIPLVAPFLSYPREQSAALDVCLRISKEPSAIPGLRTHSLHALMHLWGKTGSGTAHQQAAHILRAIKGGDKIILYSCSTSNPIHEEFSGQILRLPIVQHVVWLVPYSMDFPLWHFSPDDPIDAFLSFPPELPFPTKLLRGELRSCPGLCIPTSTSFNDFASLVEQGRLTIASRISRTSNQSRGSQTLSNRRRSFSSIKRMESIKSNALGAQLRVSSLWVLYAMDDSGGCKESKSHAARLTASLSKFYAGQIRRWGPDIIKD